MIDLSQEDIARCINEARAEVGLPPLHDTPRLSDFTGTPRPTLALKPPDYFAVTQDYIRDDITGETRAVLTWISPSGAKRCYTEKVERW